MNKWLNVQMVKWLSRYSALSAHRQAFNNLAQL